MGKELSGHHLMRVRVRKRMFNRLQETAEELTEELGEHVTVSDLVRRACYEFINTQRSLKRLENPPPELFEEAGILVLLGPLLD